MKISKILKLEPGHVVRDYSVLLRDDYTATWRGVKFDEGPFYTIRELKILIRMKPDSETIRAIHQTKKKFGGSITHGWDNK